MLRVIVRFGAVCALALVAACGADPLPGRFSPEPAARPDRNFISAEEVRASTAQNAFDAVQSMRSAWLVKRGEQSVAGSTDVVVYLNNARMGGLESLRNISLGTVAWMRYFDARQANYRWGTGHSQGAILVSTNAAQ
jgi:hypothetical protein